MPDPARTPTARTRLLRVRLDLDTGPVELEFPDDGHPIPEDGALVIQVKRQVVLVFEEP